MGGKLLKPCISENVFILSLPLADSLVGFKMLEKEFKKKKKYVREGIISMEFSFFFFFGYTAWLVGS